MRIILTYLFLILSFIGSALAAPDVSRVEEFKKMQEEVNKRISQLEKMNELVAKNCLPDPKSKKFVFEIDGKEIKCEEMIVRLNILKQEVNNEVKELEAICVEEEEKSAHAELAAQTEKIIEAPACKISPDKDKCGAAVGCSIAGAMPGLGSFMQAAGKVFKSEKLKECGSTGVNCLSKVLRGIFDSLWTNITGLWDLGAMGLEYLGVIKASERETSESAMAAQQASPGFLEQLKKDPIGTFETLGKNLFDSIQSAAINHYGCEKWSGAPLTSECLAPMSTWDCATCAQKTQVWCGIGGYALGEIPTALLTGGIFAGGKIAATAIVKSTGAGASHIASLMSRTFPKSSALAAKAGNKLGTIASSSWSALARSSVARWDSVANSPASKLISEAAGAIGKSTFGKLTGKTLGFTGDVLTHKFNPLAAYVRALDKAFMYGFTKVDNLALAGNVAAKASTVAAAVSGEVTKEAYFGSRLADEALGLKESTLKMAKDQSKATPGMIIVEQSPVTPSNLKTPPASGTISKNGGQQSAPSSKATTSGNSIEVESVSSRLGVDNTNVPALITKHRSEPEYAPLFATTPYAGYHDDVAVVISHLEKTQPNLSKADIRQTIDKVMNSCDIR